MDPERNLALVAWLESVGLRGAWSVDGPLELAQVLAHRRRLDSLDQAFALHFALAAWGRRSPKAPAAVEVLELEGATLDALAILAHRWNGRPPRR